LPKIAKRLLVAIGAAAVAFGITVPAHAQSVTVCYEAHVNVAGMSVLDQPQTCQTVP
jgi:hypothetical protein